MKGLLNLDPALIQRNSVSSRRANDENPAKYRKFQIIENKLAFDAKLLKSK